MDRRIFIKNSSLTVIGLTTFGVKDAHIKGFLPGIILKVNGQRIENRILELAKFGRNEKGQCYRVAFSKGDIEARGWFLDLMRKAGLEPIIDEAGNIIGKRKGKNLFLKPIAFGSHIDMVPDGGNYDGILGSISALEVIEVLNENNVITNHSLEVMVFADKEGSMVGSKALVGRSLWKDSQIMPVLHP